MTTELRMFNQLDWEGYSGAEALPDGSPARIGETENWVVIVSGAASSMRGSRKYVMDTTVVELCNDWGDSWTIRFNTVEEALACATAALKADPHTFLSTTNLPVFPLYPRS